MQQSCLQQLSALRISDSGQQQALCGHGDKIDNYAAQCVHRAKSLSIFVQASRKKDQELDTLIAETLTNLCVDATSLGPSDCWKAIPERMLAKNEDAHGSITSLEWAVNLCRGMPDRKPMDCMVRLKNIIGDRMCSPRKSHRTQCVPVEEGIKICRNFSGDLDLFSACVKHVPKYYDIWDRCQLCREGTLFTGVLECAITLYNKGFDRKFLASVCAASPPPNVIKEASRCFMLAVSNYEWLEPTELWNLCLNSDPDLGSLKCASALHDAAGTNLRLNVSNAEITRLCTNRQITGMFFECVRRLPPGILRSYQIVQLCEIVGDGNQDKIFYPSACIQKATSIPQILLNDSTTSQRVVRLCRNAISLAPINCVKSVLSETNLSLEQSIMLCGQAKSDQPQKCYKKYNAISPLQAVEFCSVGLFSALSECIEKLRGCTTNAVLNMVGMLLCGNATSEYPAICFCDVDSRYSALEKALICNQATNSSPIDCASLSVTRLSHSQQAGLCHKSTCLGSTTAMCAIEAPQSWSPNDVIVLCRSAKSTMPAKCASSVAPYISVPSRYVAQVCNQATSLIPAKCLSQSFARHHAESAHIIQDCSRAIPIPTYLKVTNFTHPCPSLVVKCPVRLVLQAYDQYSLHMTTLRDITLRMNVESNGSTAMLLSPDHTELVSSITTSFRNGIAMLEDVQFSMPGYILLNFDWKPDRVHWRVGHAFRIIVGLCETEKLKTKRCQSLIDKFRCFGTLAQQSSKVEDEASMLPFPEFLSFEFLRCRKVHAMTISYRGMIASSGLYTIDAADK